tara:strand:+ start:1768 stop:1998 length:231 start_codon:yes stop_codon:yes gene_type:complete
MPRSEALKKAQQKYREKNREKLNQKQNEYLKGWRSNPENAEKLREYTQRYRQTDSYKQKMEIKRLERLCLFPDLDN